MFLHLYSELSIHTSAVHFKTLKTKQDIHVNAIMFVQKRFKNEIKASLVHGDFGRIRTTRVFQTYMTDAQKALNNAG